VGKGFAFELTAEFGDSANFDLIAAAAAVALPSVVPVAVVDEASLAMDSAAATTAESS
jgi:hypothetical protein